MSLVGPTFGPETYRHSGAKPRPRQEEPCATTSFTETFQVCGDSLSDRVATFVDWVKRHDGGGRDKNHEQNAVCLDVQANGTERVLGTYSEDQQNGTQIHRLVEKQDGTNLATSITLKDGSIQGYEVIRNGNDVQGRKFEGFASFDEMNFADFSGNEAKAAYAKVFVNTVPLADKG